MTGLIMSLIIGGLAGYFAGNVMGANRPYGIPGDIGLGILGSVLGGFLFGLIGLAATGLIGQFIMSLLGAMVLIWGVRKIKAA